MSIVADDLTEGLGGGGGSESDIDASCYVDASSGTPIIQKQKNVSSITDSGVGIFTINFTAALASANYTWAFSAARLVDSNPMVVVTEQTNRTTLVLPIRVAASSSTLFDTMFSVIVMEA